jgi:hypothetical protein
MQLELMQLQISPILCGHAVGLQAPKQDVAGAAAAASTRCVAVIAKAENTNKTEIIAVSAAQSNWARHAAVLVFTLTILLAS